MAGKGKEIKKTVQLDEDQLATITEAMIVLDAGFSEVVRASVHVGLPLLMDRPHLIKIIDGLPQNSHRDLSR